MDTSEYYAGLKQLAHEKRTLYRVNTALFGLREVRNIYKLEGIRLDHWQLSWKIKALYMCEDGDCSVAVQPNLPIEPKLFALVHELKHHYLDRDKLVAGVISSGKGTNNDLIEIGAELFAAEFIYPLAEFGADIAKLGVSQWTPEGVVSFKRNCKAKVSYAFIVKSLERLGLVERDAFKDVKFKKLEEKVLGVPFYRRRRIA